MRRPRVAMIIMLTTGVIMGFLTQKSRGERLYTFLGLIFELLVLHCGGFWG